MKIYSCKTNHITNPLGYDLGKTPVLSWKVKDTEGKKAVRTQILLAADPEFKEILAEAAGDEGTVSSLGYALSMELKPYTRYYWTVSVTADNGDCAVSEVNWFETAKLDEAWEGRWITAGFEEESVEFLRELSLAEEVRDARLYICGLGIYEAYLDGEKLGDEYLAPGCIDYASWLQYQTYEMPLLTAGKHTLSVLCGNGWYKGPMGRMVRTGAKGLYGDTFNMIAEVRAQGELLLKSDENWNVKAADYPVNSIYEGETWIPGLNENTAALPVQYSDHTACLPNRHDGKICHAKPVLEARHSVPIRVILTGKPVEVIHTPAGETVLDFGQNMAGFVSFRVHEPQGVKVHLQYGEILQGGNFYRGNLGRAKAEYIYISDGKEHICRPHFTYYGFRYVKVEGLSSEPVPEDFTACTMMSELDLTGHLTTGDSRINRLILNALWGQRSNYMDTATDCPQRDERLGWTGDTEVFSGTACYQMDSWPFLSKYMHDLAHAQERIGGVPDIVPPFDIDSPSSCAWGDVATIVPWNLYQFYGDKTILEDQYESMKGWVDYIHSLDEAAGGHRLWITKDGYGDWLSKDNDNPKERFAGGTELTFLSTAYYYYSTDIVAKSADIIGKEEDAAVYGQLAEEIREAFEEEYFTKTGRLAITTQTAYALTLYFGLVPDYALAKTKEAFRDKMLACVNKLKTGFIGTAILCKALSDNGLSTLAYNLLFNEDLPGWLYAVNLGATTIWERWDSLNPDGTVNGTDMNSLNHYSYGSVVEWMYRNIIGLRQMPGVPGFKKVVIAPEIDMRLKNASCTYDSPAGRYEVSWEIISCEEMKVSVTIPFDAEATVVLPGKSGEEITLTAGSYSWNYRTDAPLWEKLNTWSDFADLREYEPAKPLLAAIMPDYAEIPAMFCHEPLRELIKQPFFPFTEAELDEIDEKLK